jgi:hypothetical protein
MTRRVCRFVRRLLENLPDLPSQIFRAGAIAANQGANLGFWAQRLKPMAIMADELSAGKTLAHSPATRPASPPRSTTCARPSTPQPVSHNSAFQTRRQPKCFGSVSLQDSSTDPADRLLVRQAERAFRVSSGCPSQASWNRLGRLPEAIVTIVSVTGCCGLGWS